MLSPDLAVGFPSYGFRDHIKGTVRGLYSPRPARSVGSMRTHPLFLISSLGFLCASYATPVVVRNAPVTLPAVKRINTTGTLNLVAHDRARIAGFRARATKGSLQPETIVGSVPATNQAVDYVVNVQIGNPATTCELLFCKLERCH